ncbi:hypothetical protein IWQ60_008013 [Tieghemiomyces parasiticus]|uniref:Major facilitator superfamily (MFS) profile domain-containing protein n=1 Tax=Tieghemiomyces parasiticus TaxID=78921 RepID=A0A9W8A3M9_9FUNG|nr:hypothetical protein IWQ60_008013 [Tieghemiomyces parasiticus]
MAAPATPLPWKQVGTLCLLRLTEPISFSVLFPFVYFMVRDFDTTTDPKVIGFYVGIVASAFSFAQLTTNMLWGAVSDRIGRRPVLLMGTMGTILCSLAFGCSRSLGWAVATRVIWGALNANASTAKTMMAEITDETNQAKGFSLLPLCWNLGTIVGPVIGGLLARPAENFPGLFGHIELFRAYPYMLPCLICSIFGVAAWLSAFFLLEETLHCKLLTATDPASSTTSCTVTPAHSRGDSASVTSNDDDGEDSGLRVLNGKPRYLTEEQQPLLGPPTSRPSYTTVVASSSTTPSPALTANRASADTCPGTDVAEEGPTRRQGTVASIVAALRGDTVKVVAGYFGLSLLAGMMDEMYPVWSATTPDLGGLGFSVRELGLTLSFSSFVVLYVQIFVYPKVQPLLGSIRCFRIGILSFAVVGQVLPALTTLERILHPLPDDGTVPPLSPVTWVILIVALIVRVIAGTLTFTSVNLLVNNSVADRQVLGTVNGFAQSMGALARALGPLTAGIVWSWSLLHDYPFPFDYHFIFLLITLVGFATYAVSRTWHPRINQRQFALLKRVPSTDSAASV